MGGHCTCMQCFLQHVCLTPMGEGSSPIAESAFQHHVLFCRVVIVIILWSLSLLWWPFLTTNTRCQDMNAPVRVQVSAVWCRVHSYERPVMCQRSKQQLLNTFLWDFGLSGLGNSSTDVAKVLEKFKKCLRGSPCANFPRIFWSKISGQGKHHWQKQMRRWKR